MGDDNQLSLLSFNQVGDGVDTGVEVNVLDFSLCLLTLDASLGGGTQTFSLGLGIFWSVFFQKLENTGSQWLVGGTVELVNRWWDLQTLEQNTSLSLETDILWPLDVSGQVKLVWSGLSNTEDLWTSNEQVLVHGSLGFWSLWLLDTLWLGAGLLLVTGLLCWFLCVCGWLKNS